MVIDQRERDIKTWFKNNPDTQDWNIQYTNLDLGDIVFRVSEQREADSDQNINHDIDQDINQDIDQDKDTDQDILYIERKTMADLAASIKDGRHREQKLRLTASGISLLYVHEGFIDPNTHYGVKHSTLYGSKVNTMVRDHIPIFDTEDVEDTCRLLVNIYQKLTHKSKGSAFVKKVRSWRTIGSNSVTETINSENGGVDRSYSKVIKLKKKANMTPDTCFIAQLSQIPGVGNLVAVSIADEYTNMINLCQAYQTCEEDKREILLANVQCTTSTGKTRKVGKVASKKIYTYLYGES